MDDFVCEIKGVSIVIRINFYKTDEKSWYRLYCHLNVLLYNSNRKEEIFLELEILR